MDYKMAKASANWWIEAMKRQCNHLYPTKVIHDGCSFVVVDSSLSQELARFEEVLYNAISDCLIKQSYLSLTCCWYPNRDLSKLLQKANISRDYLPPRAAMEICGNSVKVSLNGEEPPRTLHPVAKLL